MAPVSIRSLIGGLMNAASSVFTDGGKVGDDVGTAVGAVLSVLGTDSAKVLGDFLTNNVSGKLRQHKTFTISDTCSSRCLTGFHGEPKPRKIPITIPIIRIPGSRDTTIGQSQRKRLRLMV